VRRLTLAIAVLSSATAWLGPLALADYLQSWLFLGGYLVTVSLCGACWWAHDRAGPAG
jgi:hypothetical protein